MAAPAFLPELATQVVVPVAAVVGIAFAVLQWVLVSKVKLSPEPRRGDGPSAKSGAGASEYLIEEEEGLNEHNVVVKCAEIQNAISEGEGAEPLRSVRCRSVRLDLRISCNRAGGRVFFPSLSLSARDFLQRRARSLGSNVKAFAGRSFL